MFTTVAKKLQTSILATLLLLGNLSSLAHAAPLPAEDQLGIPVAIPIGTFGGIAYVQYDGIFEGVTSTGTFRVPYRITAPADSADTNRTVLVEPPHFDEGPGVLDFNKLGRDFLFKRGFIHASVGWSTTTDFGFGIFEMRILDPAVPGVFINGGFEEFNGRTDDEIVVDFARALVTDGNALAMIGTVKRSYITGFSDSSAPVMRLVLSGQADGVFDFALPFTTFPPVDPQEMIAADMYGGKLIILNSESEWQATHLIDRGIVPNQYRYYVVAGTPHLPDPLVPFPLSNMTTPASLYPTLRALFLQGHQWVKNGTTPPASTHFKSSDGMTLDRDANGNAITINSMGKIAPRLPFIELGEARFTDDEFHFLGIYDNVKTIQELGFSNHDKYLKAFEKKLKDYLDAGYILEKDANEMLARAALCPSLTFTEVYGGEYYENFVTIESCE